MPVVRLTKTSVAALKYQEKTEEYFDTRIAGFGVRVNRNSKTYFVQTKVRKDGSWAKMKETIGKVGILHFDDAEAEAERILRDAAAGITPADRRREEELRKQAEDERDVTLRTIFERYRIAKEKKLKSSTADLYLTIMERYCPDWLDRPIRSITDTEVISLHATVGKRSQAQADSLMRILRALFNHTINRYDDIMVLNPVRKLGALDMWYRVERRSSSISDTELPTWFAAVMDLDEMSRNYLLLLLFTGARPQEAASLKWTHLDFSHDTGVFRETKSGRPLRVPIAGYMMDKLKEQKETLKGEPTPFVFPSPYRYKSKSGHLEDIRQQIETVTVATGIEFMLSDLRRTFLSYCEEFEIPVFTTKRLCNHALPADVTEGYIQFSMTKLRHHVEKIANHILKTATGKTYRRKKAPGGK
jgi:integrase